MSKDIGDLCTECGCDTSFGHGHFVNRIPSDNGEVTGYLCADCQSVECDNCGQLSLDYDHPDHDDTAIWCVDCMVEHGQSS